MNLSFINDLTEENARVYISNRQLLEIVLPGFDIPEISEIPYISSDIPNCDMINRLLALLTFLTIEDDEIDELIDDLNILKNEICPREFIPPCLTTTNIRLESIFARYNPLRDYSFLERQFHLIYSMILQHLQTEAEPVNLGVFLITVEENITFVKASWEDERDRDNYESFVDMELYKVLMQNTTFREFMRLYITKIVQDRFVTGDCRGTFAVLLDLYMDRNTSKDHFHQDHAEKMEVDYFTLMYLMPTQRVILGASLLGLTGKSSVSVPVTNMTTLGVSNKLYHSTPTSLTSRQYSWTNPKTKSRRTHSFTNSHRNARIEHVLPSQTEQRMIELFPAKLSPLDSSFSLMRQLLVNTTNTRRTFMRTLYVKMNEPPDHFSKVETIDTSLIELMEETRTIERKTIETAMNYFVGGKKTKKSRIPETIRMLRNPKKNYFLIFKP